MNKLKYLVATGCLATALSAGAQTLLGTYGSSTYYATPDPMTWQGAENYAVSVLGGHLATVNDVGEQTWLHTAVANYDHPWIGFNDIAQEGTFVWSSGEPVTVTFWNPGEPNNAGDEDGTTINWGSNGEWNDYGTGNRLYGIVEVEPNSVPDMGSTAGMFGTALLGLFGFRRAVRS